MHYTENETQNKIKNQNKEMRRKNKGVINPAFLCEFERHYLNKIIYFKKCFKISFISNF